MLKSNDGEASSPPARRVAKTTARAGVALALTLGAGTLSTAPQAQASNLQVKTREGPVKGFLKNGVAEFLGIPYAAPPVGGLRWKPPTAPASWTAVRDATTFGPQCAQIATLGLFAGPPNNNEDCLYLNIYTPYVDAAKNEKLPVIFWIHGGGNIDGASDGYDGSKLATRGKVVVVTINYRLGLLGFIAHPALDSEGHLFGNYGLLDQQFAMKWVRRNIEAFGGDKDNITVGGQSAGSLDTQANMASPLAAGLFQRAIWESGIQEPAPLTWAEQHAEAFATAAGCATGSNAAIAKCLRGLTAAQIMNLQNSGPYGTENGVIADGQILLTQGIAATFQSGKFNHVPVISGSTHDEANFGFAITEYSENPRVPFTATDFTNYVTSTYTGNNGPGGSPPTYPPGTVGKVLARYPLYAYPTPQLAMDAVGTDGSVYFACAQRKLNRILADQVPVYAYEFDDQTAPFYFPKMPGFASLAYHTSDIQYLFPLWHGSPDGIEHPLNKLQEALSDSLVAAWTNFAWTGNPNGLGNSPWPRYELDPKRSYYLSEDIPSLSTISDAELYAEHKCDLWDPIVLP